MNKSENTKLILGAKTSLADGTWFAVGEWDYKKRAYVETAELGVHSEGHIAHEVKSAGIPGMRRIIRYTVWQGAVTTRKEDR